MDGQRIPKSAEGHIVGETATVNLTKKVEANTIRRRRKGIGIPCHGFPHSRGPKFAMKFVFALILLFGVYSSPMQQTRLITSSRMATST